MSELEKIHAQLSEKILPQILPQSELTRKYKNKVIHDHLWGSSTFYAWEVALLDTPLLQRLRNIHQLGTACYTYPSAVHNRFSHTLGVTVLAGQLITNLREKINDGTVIPHSEVSQNSIITQKDIFTIRLSALLHDIGHCFFSHCSEVLAKKEFQILSNEIAVTYSRTFSSGESPKCHELLAYFIITSPYFENYWNTNISPLFEDPDNAPNPQDFAKPIIGAFISKEKHFLTEIMNGPYDVDKLEYLHRDAKSAGLAITYDRERFFQKITLYYDSDSSIWQLVMDVHGIQSVEQMLLNKMMLAPYVYHHQKVLAADAIVQDIGRLLLEGKKHNTIKVEKYIDFLLYTDADLLAFSSTSEDPLLKKLLLSLQHRVIPKRCFVLHKNFIRSDEEDAASKAFSKIRQEIFENFDDFRQTLASFIQEKCTTKFSQFSSNDIYITNTSQKAKYKNIAKSALVLTRDRKLAPLGQYWVMGNWDETYSAKKEFIYFHIAEDKIEDGFNCVKEFIEKKFAVEIIDEQIKRFVKV